ncbi:hypothetical protein [Enterococcus mundtii]|uniref:hypothetical protein n=1 Tax=Enterococcus mundtii TaxID=53346 RepID=UPI00403C55F2
MFSKKKVEDFSFPDIIKNKTPTFGFSDDTITDHMRDSGIIGSGYTQDETDCSFFIYDSKNNIPIFSMAFYVLTEEEKSFYNQSMSHGKIVILDHICTNPKLRNKGIATYYINELKSLCKTNDVKKILVHPVSDGIEDPNKLSLDQLRYFYLSFSTNDVLFEII